MSSKRYTSEFRAEAIRQVTEREYPVQKVAKRLGVSTYSLYKWLKGAEVRVRGGASSGVSADDDVPGSEDAPQRILRVALKTAIVPGGGGRSAPAEDPNVPPGQP